MNGCQDYRKYGSAQNANLLTGTERKEKNYRIECFMKHVEVSDNGCWVWIGATKPGGYGVFAIRKNNIQKTYNAHRWAYIHLFGEIPENLTIDHLCRNTRCVNPSHMEIVTIRENILRGNGFAGINARKEMCKRGHELVPLPDHRKVHTSAKRHCQICERIDALQWNKDHRKRKNANNRRYDRKNRLAKNPTHLARRSIYTVVMPMENQP